MISEPYSSNLHFLIIFLQMHAVIFCCRRRNWDETLSLTHDSLWGCEQVSFKYTREYLNTKNSVKTEKSKNLSSQSWRDNCYCNNILLTHIACGQSLHTLIPPFLQKQSTQYWSDPKPSHGAMEGNGQEHDRPQMPGVEDKGCRAMQ